MDETPDAIMTRAMELFHRGDPACVPEFQVVLELDPDHVAARTQLLYALFRLTRYREARSYAEEFLKRDPSKAYVHRFLGMSLAALKDWRRAAAELERCLDIDPNDIVAHHYLAVCLQRMQRPQDALVHLEEALRLNPDDVVSLSAAAGAYLALPPELVVGPSGKAGLHRAQQLARRLTEIKPGMVDGWRALGAATARSGDIQHAAEVYREGLRIHPDDGVLHEGLAACYVALRQWIPALREAALAVRWDRRARVLLKQQWADAVPWS